MSTQHALPDHNRSVEAEQSIIGCLMVDPDYVKPHLAKLLPGDFTDPTCRAFIRAYAEGAAPDALALATRAAHLLNKDPMELHAWATGRYSETISVMNVAAYVEIVSLASQRRKTLDVISKAVKRVYEGVDPKAIRVWINDALKSQAGTTTQPLSQIVDAAIEEMLYFQDHPMGPNEVRGVSTGYPEVDGLLGDGMEASLIIGGARPSVGKTSLWFKIAFNVATHYAFTSLFITNEMQAGQLVGRLACSEAGIDRVRMRRGLLTENEMVKYRRKLQEIGKSHLEVMYATRLQDIVGAIYATDNLGLVVIDYLNQIEGGQGENRNQQYGYVSRVLLEAANELNIPVVLLAQLSREVVRRGQDALPVMTDLRDSGELEMNADIILMLHRTEEDPHDLQVLLRKNRLNGGQNNFTHLYFGNYAEIRSAARRNQWPPEGAIPNDQYA